MVISLKKTMKMCIQNCLFIAIKYRAQFFGPFKIEIVMVISRKQNHKNAEKNRYIIAIERLGKCVLLGIPEKKNDQKVLKKVLFL